MPVLMPNASLGVRGRAEGLVRNSHGERVLAGWTAMSALHPGRTREQSDGTWSLGVDPALWPVRVGDLVVSDGGAGWLVQTTTLIRNNLDPRADWVRITGVLRGNGGTVPGGAWFVGRYTSDVDADPTTSDPVLVQANLWTGTGPPPDPDPVAFPAEEGDEYVDMLTGTVYTLRGA